MTTDANLTVIDLFAGAGGLSTGVAKACESVGLEPATDIEFHAVNHWEPAIATYENNHPWAEHDDGLVGSINGRRQQLRDQDANDDE